MTDPMNGAMGEAAGALMVCGTTSNAGKTTMVAGLCRLLARAGVRVAPFKAQNMALNSAVTRSGHEIGRAQYLQAQAAGLDATVEMNPVLLKPTGERSSQVIVMGHAIGEMSAQEYYDYKPELFTVVTGALADLRAEYDVVLLEGAGSPAELNLLPHDIVNLRLAKAAAINAVVVGDIDPGGVFAALYGTVKVLPAELAPLVKGFIINKLRGDPALLLDGTDQLEELSGVPTLGVVPMLRDFHLDAEDSLNLAPSTTPGNALDVAIIWFPHISNFTDFDPLRVEPDVSIRFIRAASELGSPDLVILPGTKATVADLNWLRSSGIADAILRLRESASSAAGSILGICGGYQMLGHKIDDSIESGTGVVQGLGLLDCSTTFGAAKVLAQVGATADGVQLSGYQIHHGRVQPSDSVDIPGQNSPAIGHERTDCWIRLDSGKVEGLRQGDVYGTTIHGLFEADEFRHRFLESVAATNGSTLNSQVDSFAQIRNGELDRLADHLEASLELADIIKLINLADSLGAISDPP